MVFERHEPGQMKAGALALLVHLLFLGLMIFGVSWHNNEPAAVEVALWSALPSTASKPVPLRLQPEPVAERKVEPKPAPRAKAPKPEPLPEARPNRAEIELKAKEARQKEEEQKAREAMRKEEEQKKLKLKEEALEQQKEKLRLEQEKREQEKKVQQEKAEKLRQQQAQAQAQADAEKALKAQAAARNMAAQNMVGDYTGKIRAKIKSKTILPPDLAGNPQAEFDVTLMPTGEVLNLKLTRSSGSSAYDSAVERAIYKAQPLPLPPDPTLFGEFRELHLKFRLHED